jgi:hypothetical protein
MKAFVVVALIACGGKQTPPPSSGSGSAEAGPVKDTRNEFQKRLATACESVGKRITECAVADAKKEVAAGRMTQKDFDLNTKPEILEKNTEEFVKKCDVPAMTSRQVRVLEVCHKEETECDPFLDCLSHLNDPAK